MQERGTDEFSDLRVCASSCAADRLAVLPLLQHLRDTGCAFWHEEAESGDGDVSEGATQQLGECAVFLTFVSHAYQESHACRSLFNRAMQQEKPFVAVLLEEFEASPALRMQLASVQAVRAYAYEEFDELAAAVADAVAAKAQTAAGRALAETEEPPEEQPAPEPSDWAGTTVRGDSDTTAHRPNVRPWHIGVVGVVAAVALLAALFFGGAVAGFGGFGQPETEGSYVVSAAQPALTADNSADCLLTASDDASVEKFHEAVDVLKGRLDAFVGVGKYDLVVRGNRLQLVVPTECLDGNPLRAILQMYLTRPLALSLVDASLSDKQMTAIALARSDIESVSVADSFANAAVLPADVAADSNSFGAVRITLSEEFADAHAGAITAMGKNLRLVQDGDYDRYYFLPAAISDDGRSLYAFLEKPRPEDLESLAYSYAHDPLPIRFSYRLNYASEAEWEQVAGQSDAGENQVDRESLGSEVVTVAYGDLTTYFTPSEGDLLDWEDALRERFDAFGSPYAIGTFRPEGNGAGETPKEVVVAVPSSSFEESQLWAIGYGGNFDIELHSGKKSVEISPWSASALTVSRDEAGRAQVMLDETGLTDVGHEDKLVSQLLSGSSEGDLVHFVVEDSIICSAAYAGYQDGVYTFTDVKTPAGIAVEGEAGQWVAGVLQTYMGTQARMPSSVKLIDYELTIDDRLEINRDVDIVNDPLNDEISKAIREVAPDCRIRTKDGTTWVFLGLPADENLAADGLQATRELYEAVAFRSPAITRLNICLIDEDDSAGERARVCISWDPEYGTIEPDVEFFCLLFDGRVDEYRDDFEHIFLTDEFWKQQYVDAPGMNTAAVADRRNE